MASTQYTSIVEMFIGCPFDNSYEHSLEAIPLADKKTWLETYCTYDATKDKFENLMLIKLDTSTDLGTIRLAVENTRAFSYNYAYIKNANSGFEGFVFITGCRYINDEKTGQTTKAVYEFDVEIDLIMTNLVNNGQLRTCFVERMHATSDLRYENIVPEPIAIPEHFKIRSTDLIRKRAEEVYGPGVPADQHSFDPAYSALVIAVADAEGWQVQMDGVYMPVTLYYVGMNDPGASTQIRTIFRNHSGTDHEKDIVACYMVPKFLISDFYHTGSATDGSCVNNNKYVPTTVTLDLEPVYEYRFGGSGYYEPKNKKLYSYPYRYSVLTTHEGNDVLLRDEFFSSRADAKVQMYFTVTPSPVLRVVPKNYANLKDLECENCALEIGNFPMVPWAYSAYDRFIADSFGYKVKRAGGIKGYLADFVKAGSRYQDDTNFFS